MSVSRIAMSIPRLMPQSMRMTKTSIPMITATRSLTALTANKSIINLRPRTSSGGCDCGGTCAGFGSLRSNRELNEFLESEIELEKKAQRKALPSPKGWSVTTEGANVTLTKKINDEEVTIRANVNHAVDAAGPEPADDAATDEKYVGEMICKPEFSVEIKRGNETLGINCSFAESEDEEDQRPDEVSESFHINEISIFSGEFKDDNYVVSGEVMDGNMYDLLMNLLQDRGIDDAFVKTFTDYCTVYEHGQYVGLLEKLKGFVGK